MAEKTTNKKNEKASAPKEVKAAVKNDKAKTGEKKEANPDRYRLKKRYAEEILPALMKEQNYSNVMEVPALNKIIVNMRIGDIKDNSKSISLAVSELEAITGQKCIITKARKSVANFKLREGQSVGIKCTLRGNRMYEFLDKLISIALPRVRDFRGLSPKSFDGRGNYALGVKEQLIFPEISYEKIEKVRGFDISVVTTARSDSEAKALLTKLGMPFRN